jgi:hypothetical protein
MSTDMVALDLEAGYGDLGPWTIDFCRRVQERLNTVPLIYTGRWFSEPHNLGSYPEIADFPLWLAAYQPAMPAPPAPWSVVSFWQYSSSGQIPGIVGDVDLNVFNGTAEHLPLMGKLPSRDARGASDTANRDLLGGPGDHRCDDGALRRRSGRR